MVRHLRTLCPMERLFLEDLWTSCSDMHDDLLAPESTSGYAPERPRRPYSDWGEDTLRGARS